MTALEVAALSALVLGIWERWWQRGVSVIAAVVLMLLVDPLSSLDPGTSEQLEPMIPDDRFPLPWKVAPSRPPRGNVCGVFLYGANPGESSAVGL